MNNKSKRRTQLIKRQLALPSGNLTPGEIDELWREDYDRQVTLADELLKKGRGRYIFREEY